MTETIDQLIHARFDAVASPIDVGDWGDVVARARAARPLPSRLALVAAAAAVLAATMTAVAFGWPQTVIDFFESPPAPESVQAFFRAYGLPVPSRVSPQANVGRARKIATETFDVNGNGHLTSHTLYVAPRKGGGFCFLWTNASGGCFPSKGAPRTMGPLGVDWFSTEYALLAIGWVRTGATRTVEARFADGTTATIPVTWVSAPVSAGFLVYPVPARAPKPHRRPAVDRRPRCERRRRR